MGHGHFIDIAEPLGEYRDYEEHESDFSQVTQLFQETWDFEWWLDHLLLLVYI